MKNKIALIFDLDDTLIFTHFRYVKAKTEFIQLLERIVKDKNLFSDSDDFNKHMSRFQKLDASRVETFLLDKNRFCESMIIYMSLVFGHYHQKWDCKIEQEIKTIANQIWDSPITVPNVMSILSTVKNKGYDLYCLTAGCPEKQMNKFYDLKESGEDLSQFFNDITVVPMKNEQAYIDFKSQFPNYDKYVMTGDNVRLDVVPSLAVGMSCIWVKQDNGNSTWNGTAEINENDPNLSIAKTLEEAQKIILEKYPII